jgi:hypothetical protein
VGVAALSVGSAHGGDDKIATADDPQVKAFVAHLAKQGIKLQYAKDGWWTVTDPKGDGYEVVVMFRTFPATATEKEMRDRLHTINLAHLLNIQTKMAMSYPGLRATDATKKLPKLNEVPVCGRLEGFFNEYQPPEVKK